MLTYHIKPVSCSWFPLCMTHLRDQVTHARNTTRASIYNQERNINVSLEAREVATTLTTANLVGQTARRNTVDARSCLSSSAADGYSSHTGWAPTGARNSSRGHVRVPRDFIQFLFTKIIRDINTFVST